MANSWINAAYVLGFELTLACPEEYDPDPSILERAVKSGAKVRVVRDPTEAARDAHVVSTDVWASMGQEEEQNKGEGVPRLQGGRQADEGGRQGRDLPPLPSGAPW